MRLVTRADFDGLACGALITKFEKIDSYLFVEPKFMQDGLVEVRGGRYHCQSSLSPQLHALVRPSHYQHHAAVRPSHHAGPRRVSACAQRRTRGLRIL